MSSPARSTVVDQLEQEWQPLVQHRLRSAFSRWRSAHPSLRRFERPSQLLRFLHTAPSAATDEPLLALLILARDDTAAGRFVLQAVLPALKAQAQRLARRRVPHDELWELLLFYAWQAIRTYPVARRSRTVAANLVLQVPHDTTRELDRCPRPAHTRRRCPAGDRALPITAAACRRPRRSPTRRAFLVLAAVRANVISRRDATLILRSRFQDIPLRVLAEEADVPYQALLKRRQRAEQTLREWRRAQGNVRNRSQKVLTSSGHQRRRRPERVTRRCRRPCDRTAGSRFELKEGF
jgi:hypothetical protein